MDWRRLPQGQESRSRCSEGVDFEVERGRARGESSAQSGSGKSTLLHVLGLLDTPDEGEVSRSTAGGSTIKARSVAATQLRNRTFGFIFQFYHLLPELTALENVMITAPDPPRPVLVISGNRRKIRKTVKADARGVAGAGRPGPPARP